eukprot:GILK01006607.1.p1 GENE.GILK01006607.1~~GILK01006607.1.p1  ORF type:complete len:1413 (-),score=360.36 GILK01006607.1:147-4334(-)
MESDAANLTSGTVDSTQGLLGVAKIKPDLLFAFGSAGSSGLKDAVSFSDDDGQYILYPVGRQIAIRHVETTEIYFIKQQNNVDRMTAVSVAPNRRYFAVCEMLALSPVAQVSVYEMKAPNFKRVRVLQYYESISKEFISVGFSSDAKFVVCLTGGPDYAVVVWDWFKNKPVASYTLNSPVNRISFNPGDAHQLCTTGPNHFRLWRIQESTLKPFPAFTNLKDKHFTDHAWTDDERIVGTCLEGEIYIVEQCVVKQIIDAGLQEKGIPIHTVKTFSKGFIVGGDDGLLALWERAEESELDGATLFDFNRLWHAGRSSAVTALSMSHTEDVLACSFKSNDIGICSLSNMYLNSEAELQFKFISTGFHAGPVTGLDVCMHRPLFVTCCRDDGTVRIWNYATKNCELARKFVGDAPLSVAFHPSGYYLVVGFVDKLRVFHILHEELRLYREVGIKNARDIKFSNGGHLFCASSGKQLTIFNSYTLDMVAILRGHTNTIKDFTWSDADKSLISVGLDGAMFEWKVEGFKRVRESVLRTSEYFCSAVTPNGTVITAGLDQGKPMIRQILENDEIRDFSAGGSRIVQLCTTPYFHRDQIVFAATHAGSLRLYPSPLLSSTCDEYNIHSGAVTKIRLSVDGRYLFTCGEDGCIFIFEMRGLDLGRNGSVMMRSKKANQDFLEESTPDESTEREPVTDEALAEVVMINRVELDKRQSRIELLESQLEELQSQVEYKLHQREQEYQDKTRADKEQEQMELRRIEERYEQLKGRKNMQEREAAQALQAMELAHMRAAEELESLYERKLAIEAEKYLALDQEKMEMQQGYESRIRSMEKQQEEAIEKLLREFREQAKEAQSEFAKMKSYADETKQKYEEMIAQQEDDHENELSTVKTKAKEHIDSEKSLAFNLKGEAQMLKRRYKAVEEEKEDVLRMQRETQAEIRGFKRQIDELEKTISVLRQEKKEREDTLKEKEKKIYEYKVKIKDLQKFKHVLDFRLQEMRQTLEPKEIQIDHLKEQLMELESEFEKQLRTVSELETVIEQKNQKIHRLSDDMKHVQEKVTDRDAFISRFTHDLTRTVTGKEPREWPDELRRLYQTYVKKDAVEKPQKDPESVEEMERQIRYMERSISTLRMRTHRSDSKARGDIQKKTLENSQLLAELNDIRMEKKKLQHQVQQLQMKVRMMEVECRAVSSPTPQPVTSPTPDPTVNSYGAAPATVSTSNRTPSPDVSKPVFRPLSAKTPKRVTAGKLYKGTMTAASSTVSLAEKHRMAEMLTALEDNNSQIQMQKMEINYLREQLQFILEDRQGTSSALSTNQNIHLQGHGPGNGLDYSPGPAEALLDQPTPQASPSESMFYANQQRTDMSHHNLNQNNVQHGLPPRSASTIPPIPPGKNNIVSRPFSARK